ncbi:hypothetical protein [Halodesulfovibrio sp.]|uniref:hypothetical protein n=1 Tax=Halodesulfovibrio sp. TaxID=1912772 RepID=UPI0025C5D078|nr:hypothetical protein [Halodesulfovibrio sp.]
MANLFDSAKELYERDRLWRILAELFASGAAAMCLIMVLGGAFGGSTSTGSSSSASAVTSSYTPAVPPQAFSNGSSAPSGGGNVINMPVPQEVVESDQRLKELHIAAQRLMQIPDVGTRCEQLVPAIDKTTSYDRKRGRPVHQKIFSQGDICKKKLAASDVRLNDLQKNAEEYQLGKTGQSTVLLANSYKKVEDFDKKRTAFSQYSFACGLGKEAVQAKHDSSARLDALQKSYEQFLLRKGRPQETILIERFSALTALDKGRPESNYRKVIDSSEAIVTASQKRNENLALIDQYADAVKRGDKAGLPLAKITNVLRGLSGVSTAFISSEQQKKIALLREHTANEQLALLQKYAQMYSATNTVANMELLSEQYDVVQKGYAQYMARVLPATVALAQNVETMLKESDVRLKTLLTCSDALAQQKTNMNVRNLLIAQRSLTAFDYQRFTPRHQQAIVLANEAASGKMQSDQRLNLFRIAYTNYMQQGCTKATLANLKGANASLTVFDLERAPNDIRIARQTVQSYLTRNYCLEGSKRKIRPVMSIN